jgi:hypothetical protein
MSQPDERLDEQPDEQPEEHAGEPSDEDQAERIAVPDENIAADTLEGIGAFFAGDEREAERPSPEAPGQATERDEATDDQGEIRPTG